MANDYFAILGLTPGHYEPREITRRFQNARAQVLAELSGGGADAGTRQRLDDLHLAHATLRSPSMQARYLSEQDGADDAERLRRLIAASLEDGLLRYSRRRMILAEARELGFNDFQTQVLIAQVQFGEDEIDPVPRAEAARRGAAHRRIWAHTAAIGLLATAFFLLMIHWVSGR